MCVSGMGRLFAHSPPQGPTGEFKLSATRFPQKNQPQLLHPASLYSGLVEARAPPSGGEMPVLRRVGHPFPGPGPHPHPLPSLSYPPNRLPRRGHRAFPPEGKESSSAVTPEEAALSGPPAPVLGALGGGHPPSSPRGDGAPSPPCLGRQHACVKPHKSQIRGETGIFSLTLNNSPRAGDGLRDPVNRSCPRLSPGSHFLARGRSCCCS